MSHVAKRRCSIGWVGFVLILLGGPWGPKLRGDAFKRARAYVVDVFGELADQPREPVKE